MRAVIQRVSKAEVTVKNEECARINRGLVVLVGVEKGDNTGDIDHIAKKVLGLRIFASEKKPIDLSITDINGEILAVSQFTLLANTNKGRRPSFEEAETPEKASALFDRFVDRIKESGLTVETGRFGEHMELALTNDGPVTIIVDSRKTP